MTILHGQALLFPDLPAGPTEAGSRPGSGIEISHSLPVPVVVEPQDEEVEERGE